MATLRELTIKLGIKTDASGFQKAQQAIGAVVNTAMDLVRTLQSNVLSDALDRMVEAGSDIEETANKFAVVFGNAATGVQQELDNIRKHTGATNLELQKMASSIGSIVKPALGSSVAAGKVSSKISLLALDISSLNNVTSDEALIALRSGLMGSAEPLFRFGVDTRVAAIEQEALRHGIRKSYDEMQEGERIMLRVATIQRQLGAQGATGDATRTANQFANASRNLKAAIQETIGTIGKLLLKTRTLSVLDMRRTIDRIQDWIKANRRLIQQGIDEFMKRVHRILNAVKSVTMDVVASVTRWYDSLGPVIQRWIKIAALVAAFAVAMTLPFAPILLLIGLVALLIDDFQTWRQGGESLIGDFIKNFPGVIAVVKKLGDTFIEIFRWGLKWFRDQNLTAKQWGEKILWIVAKIAAAWALAKLPLVVFQGIFAAIVALLVSGVAVLVAFVAGIIWLGQELVKLFMGQENFFSAMGRKLGEFVSRIQNIAPIMWDMLQTALKFWLKFFGMTEDGATDFVNNLYQTLIKLWDNVLKYWSDKLGGWWDKWSSFIDFGFGRDEEARRTQAPGVSPPAVPSVLASPGAAIPAPGRGGVGAVNQTQNVNMTINPSPGMDERRLAESIVRELERSRSREYRAASQSIAVGAP